MNATIEAIQKNLVTLAPESVEIIDESHKHRGHAGAKDGGGHFRMTIVSSRFAGKSPVARHRMVYDALRSLEGSGFHALSITAKTPEET